MLVYSSLLCLKGLKDIVTWQKSIIEQSHHLYEKLLKVMRD